MISLRTLWQRITTTRYMRALEAEVTRLRSENRALLNSILGIAGVPPLPVVVAPPGLPAVAGAASRESRHDLPVDARSPLTKQNGIAAIPMRRRSWQQINRMLEFESTKKKDANAAT
jgi:hypothetical protein